MMPHKLFTLGLTFILLLVACQTPAAPTAVPTSAPSQPATSEPVPTEAPAITEPVDENDESEVIVPAPPVEEEGDAEPITVRIGWPDTLDTLNPAMAQLISSAILLDLTYDTLYQLALDGSIIPRLAEAGRVSPDGLEWTFTIADGFVFHDGQPLTAADVAFTYNLALEHEEFWTSQYVTFFESVTAPDERTVVIVLSEAIPNMESQLVWMHILPEHIWGPLGDDVADFDNAAMIGSGPFRLVEYVAGESVQFTAVDNHPLYTPQIEELIFYTFADTEAMVAALQEGEVDLITEVPIEAIDTLRAEANIELAIGQPLTPNVTNIILNQITSENCPPDDGICSGHPALADHDVRLALAHATDKQGIIDTILDGQGTPGRTIIPEGLGLWFNDNLEDYAFDIALANEILDTAGYLDQDGDGVRETADGLPLTFRIYWPDDTIRASLLADLLAESWGEIGVTFSVMEGLDFDSLLGACCPSFDFDIIIWSWSTAVDPDFMLMVMTSDQIPTGWNETGYANPEYDALYAQQAITLDQEERIALVKQMQEIVFDDIVYIIPYSPLAIQAYRSDRFTGWITDQDKQALETILSLTAIEPVR